MGGKYWNKEVEEEITDLWRSSSFYYKYCLYFLLKKPKHHQVCKVFDDGVSITNLREKLVRSDPDQPIRKKSLRKQWLEEVIWCLG